MRNIPLLSWARYFFIAAVVLALIGVIPAVWFPLQLGKLAVCAVLVLMAAALFFFGGGVGGVFGKRGSAGVFLVALLPLMYLLSYAFSTDRSVGFLGYSVEGDTIMFAGFGSLVFLFSFFLFRRFAAVRMLLTGVFFATVVAVLFQFVSILFGTRVLSSLFSDPSVNLVGKWNDLGLLGGLALMLLLVGIESAPLTPLRKVFAWCAVAVSVLFLALVQFPLIWGLLLGGCAVLGIWSFLSRPKQEDGRSIPAVVRGVPWVPVAGALVSILFLLWGASVQGGLTKVFPVSSLEVRPAISTTFDIVRASHGSSFKRFLVGTGPETFGDDWFLYKPVQINQSQFWNLNFNVGYSTFATALDTVGVLGALAWALPLVLVLLGMLRVMRSSEIFSREEKVFAFAVGLSSIYLWASAFLYVPSENILLLAFVLSGASFAFSMKTAAQQTSPETAESFIRSLAFKVVVAACVLVLAFTTFFILRRYVAEMYTNEGLYALQQNNFNSASSAAQKALSVEKTGDSLQLAIQAGAAQMQSLVNTTTTPTPAVQAQFTTLAQQTITYGQQAIAANPSDYRAYLDLGSVYSLLATLGVQGAYETAVQAYASAASHNPTDPEIPLAVARLDSAHNDTQGTTAALQQALQLKSDYTDAILFLVQLDVTNKDIPSAINAAKAAVSSAPGTASIWFELGLLYYSNNDTVDAIPALEQAVSLESDYANAKYFLGLSYAAQNRMADAIQQFKDLEVTNPTNTEVKLILSNLEAGKAPFDGAQPPVTSTPQDRTNAPIQ